MAKTAILSVRMIGDARSAKQAMTETEQAAGRLDGVASKIGGALTAAAAAGGAALIGLGVSAVQGAGELEQSIGAIDTVFKGSADQMHQWASGAADAVGLTANEYNNLGTLIGTQLKNGGTAMEELAPKTNQLIELGADLSSMFGGSTADAVGALSSALKGERDPIEKYGVSLTQAAIDAKAAELGFSKVGGSLSAEASQAATLALIMEQTADAHGNFAKESDTLQGKTQRLKASLTNMRDQLGMALLPIVTKVTDILGTTLVPVLGTAATAFTGMLAAAPIEQIFTGLTGAMQPLGGLLSTVGQIFGQLAPILGQIITQGIIPLVSGLSAGLVPVLTSVAQTVLPPVISALSSIAPTIGPALAAVGEFGATLGQQLAPIIGQLKPIVEVVFGVLGAVIGTVLGVATGLIRGFSAVLRGDFGGALTWIRTAASTAWSAISGVFSSALNGIRGALSGAVSQFVSLGSNLMSGLWRGITSVAGRIVQSVVNTVTNAVNAAKRALGIHSPSTVFAAIGTNTGLGLVEGLRDITGKVATASERMVAAAIPSSAPTIDLTAIATPATASTVPTQQITININGGYVDDSTIGRIREALNADARRRGVVPANQVAYA